ncbi:MAG TPA: hypothetical protein VFB66_22700, partial [Tepidisphaeraceae bacterium]|nr:hypothetical protein [Tepidisphaeraceae bacterium]
LGFAGLGRAFFAPAIAGLFFVPAVIAFLAETGRAMRAAVMLDDPAPAFQPVIPKPVLPVEEAAEAEAAHAPESPSSRGASATRDLGQQ